MYKIIGADKKEYGPISVEQLRQWISEGRVQAQTPALAEGGTEWKPLSAFPEFGLGAVAFSPPPKPPGAIKVFGILNIVFGSLGLLCTPISFVGLRAASAQNLPPLMLKWMVISIFVGVIASGVLLASGIGLCQFKSWARKLALYYALFGLVFGAVGICITIGSFASAAGTSGPERIGGMIGGLIGGLIGLTYDVLLLFFMSRRQVKAALGEPVD